MSNNGIVNVPGVGSASAFGNPSIKMRTYFSLHHIGTAAHFARLSKKVETEHSGTMEEEQFKQHRAYVTGSIVMAVSFLEATINELFSDAQEGVAEQIRQLPSDTVTLLANMWGLPKTESFSILEKYQLALMLGKRPLFDKGLATYQNAQLLNSLRNALVHYKPEWVEVGQDQHKWEGQLRAVGFALNPMLPTNPFFPDQCLSHGCAKWAVESSLQFVREFCGAMGITPRFDSVPCNLATE